MGGLLEFHVDSKKACRNILNVTFWDLGLDALQDLRRAVAGAVASTGSIMTTDPPPLSSLGANTAIAPL